MSSAARSVRHRYTYGEYLAYERDSGMKHEYDAGDIIALAGGSRRHNALASRVSAALEAGHPDASMVCRAIEGDPADPSGTTITNPTLVVEVLSASTEEDDRGGKWQHYQLIPSLQEYVLVSQSLPRVERYRRLASGGWEYQHVREGSMPLLPGTTLDLTVLYTDLPD